MAAGIAREPVWHLKNFNFFATIPPEVLAQFHSAFSHAPCAPKTRRETIYLPEDASDRLFMVKNGRIVLGQTGEDGKEVLFDIVNPGELFGEMAAVGEGRRTTFARALERSVVCALHMADFRRMVGETPYLLAAVDLVIGTRAKRLEAVLTDMVFKDAAGRLATVLLRIADEAGVREHDGVRLDVRLSQEEYGGLIGTTRETVSQLFGKFTDAGLIARAGRAIRLVDSPALAALAGLDPAALTAP